MNVSVFGLGYVGTVVSSCLADIGHTVIAVDIKEQKVKALNNGELPQFENGLQELVKDGLKAGRLRATVSTRDAVNSSEISLVCVGTPSRKDGTQNLEHVISVSREIGEALKGKTDYHVIAYRSTMLPGTIEDCLIPQVERYSKKRNGIDFGVGFNPEFLREGSAVEDFFEPERIVIGANDSRVSDALTEMYKTIKAPSIKTDIKTAEMVKYADNIFHGLKVAFANEIGRTCKRLGIDGVELMKIFAMDKKLNLSSYYLTPGLPFGGSCLVKDISAFKSRAKELDLSLPVLDAILKSNREHIIDTFETLKKFGLKEIGILGLSFKEGTDDMRNSPVIALAQMLIKSKYKVSIYDPLIDTAKLSKEEPKLFRTFCSSLEELMAKSRVIVVAQRDLGKKAERLIRGHVVLELVRALDPRGIDGVYNGICW